MTARSIEAPAKINLGLEILGRRTDGFHEIKTILCTISLRDTLTFEPSPTNTDQITFEPDSGSISDDQNLILRALNAMRAAGAQIAPQLATVHKRIPAAAGLGGASSDAAATLVTFRNELTAAGADMGAIAATLGSDVPFFLNGPIALASGRGEILRALPAPESEPWVVLVTPNVHIPNKTKTMYGVIDHAWWSSGERVQAIADRLPSLPTCPPPNVFERALLTLVPDVSEVPRNMAEAGAPFVALTGAGPTFYTIPRSRHAAESLASRLREAGLSPVVSKIGWRP